MKNFCIKCKHCITTEEYHFSYNHFGKALCRKHQPTAEARLLGEKLKEIGKWTVEYEAFDGYKSVDISIPYAKVYIEVDGLQHVITKEQALSDIKRAYYSYKKKGFITLHVPNIIVRDADTIDETAKFINDFLEESFNDVQEAEDSWIIRFFRGLFS
jgi:very-short-patch-repair endonuclease